MLGPRDLELDMPNEHHTHPTNDAPPSAGRTFYAPARDAVAYLLSGVACALLVAYTAMLVAWIFSSGSS